MDLLKINLEKWYWKEKWFELSNENKTWNDKMKAEKVLDVTNVEFVDYEGVSPSIFTCWYCDERTRIIIPHSNC